MNKIKLLSLLGVLLCLPAMLFAQNGEPEMATLLRSNGKIYVVVTCTLVIFIGIVVYLIVLDRKLSKLEKMSK